MAGTSPAMTVFGLFASHDNMGFMRRIVLAAILALATPAFADGIGVSADTKANNAAVINAIPDAKDVFLVQGDGGILHLQSGFVCPADFPHVHFVHALIFSRSSSIGTDVGCDYARNANDGNAVSKLTIFLVKADEGATLDAAFGRYKTEVLTAAPGATILPASLHMGDKQTGQDRTDYRAAGFAVPEGNSQVHSELIVGIFKGWIIEVRATYPSAVIKVEKGMTQEQIHDQLFDIEGAYIAFMKTTGTDVGHS
jgi:hypothetical protein